MKRNHSIDVLRFIAAFAVIVIHIGFTRPPWEAQIRLIARFAVPFFFLASGYFFEKKLKASGNEAFISTVLNLLSVYLIANLVYLPVNILSAFHHHRPVNLTLSNLLLGTWNHLWFLGSMVVGYLTLWLLYHHRLQKILPVLSVFFLALMILAESYAFLGFRFNVDLARTFLSIPLIYTGMLLSKYKVEEKAGMIFFVSLAVFAILLHGTETILLYQFKKVPIGKLQFFISTTLMAISFLCLSLKIETPKENWFSECGRKYSLLIYLYHPLVLMWSPEYFAFIPPRFIFFEWISPLLAMCLVLFPVILIEKYFPFLFNLMNGKLSRSS